MTAECTAVIIANINIADNNVGNKSILQEYTIHIGITHVFPTEKGKIMRIMHTVLFLICELYHRVC